MAPRWDLAHDRPPAALEAATILFGREVRARLTDRAHDLPGGCEELTFLADDPLAALDASLSLVSDPGLHQLSHVTVALGMGVVDVVGAAAFGVELSRVRRLAWLVAEHTLHCTAAFLGGVAWPLGVGVHRAPEALEVRAGFPVHQVVDYRDTDG